MASELKPCPFCGVPEDELMILADPEEAFDNSGPSRRIQCAGCHIEAPFYPSRAEAIAAWNTRPAPVDANPLASNPVDDKIKPDINGKAPAATDTGLETVEHQYWHDQTQEWLPTGFPDRYRKDGSLVRELVTRSQAEELLAEAERRNAELERELTGVRNSYFEEKKARLADNATKDARIKELGEDVEWAQNAVLARQRHAEARCEALEAKLAVANDLVVRAQVIIPDHYVSWHRDARAVLGGKPS